MIQEILNTVKAIEAGAQADPSGTLVLIGIGAVAILAAIVAMAKG